MDRKFKPTRIKSLEMGCDGYRNDFGSLESTKVSFGTEQVASDGYCFMFRNVMWRFRRSSSSAFKNLFETSCSVPRVGRLCSTPAMCASQDVISVNDIEGLHRLEDYWVF